MVTDTILGIDLSVHYNKRLHQNRMSNHDTFVYQLACQRGLRLFAVRRVSGNP